MAEEDGNTEFFIPANIRDLEDSDKMHQQHPNAYYVLSAVQVGDWDPDERYENLHAILHDLGHRPADQGGPAVIVRENAMFDTLYSYVRELGTPGMVNKECRRLLGTEVPSLLAKLKKSVERFLTTPNARSNPATIKMCRSAIKMYIFILSHVLCSTYFDDSHQIAQKIGGRKRKADRDMFEADQAGLDISSKEKALSVFVDVMSLETASANSTPLLWPQGGLEESLLNLMLRVSLHLMAEKVNVDGGGENPVGTGIERLLASVIGRFVTAYSAAKALQETEGRQGQAMGCANPTDQVVVPLTELLMKSPWSAKFCSALLAFIDREMQPPEDQQAGGAWPEEFQSMFYNCVWECAMSDVGNDSHKNIALFLEEEAMKHTGALHKMKEQVLSLTNCSCEHVRKSAFTCLAQLIIHFYHGALRPQEEAMRNAIMEELLFHIRDLNHFTRAHCLKTWIRLLEVRSIPRMFMHRVAQEAVGRLTDRNNLVRKYSLEILVAFMTTKSVMKEANVLSLSLLQQKYEEHAAGAQQRFEASNIKREPVAEGEEVQPQTFTAALDQARQIVGVNTTLSTTMIDATMAPGQDPTNPPSAISTACSMGGHGDPELNRLVMYEQGIEIVKFLHVALEHAGTMLTSKTPQDILDAIHFITAASEFQLDNVEEGVRKVLVMVFMQDEAVQRNVVEAFTKIFFFDGRNVNPPPSPLALNVARALKLIKAMEAANEGEICSIERIFTILHKTTPVSDYFVKAVWGVVSGDFGEPNDRQISSRLFSILMSVASRNVSIYKGSILEVMHANPTDNVLLRWCFEALSKEAYHRGFVPIRTEDIQAHPVTSLAIKHLCRPTKQLGTWWQLAVAAINYVHETCQAPMVFYTHVSRILGAMYEEQVKVEDGGQADMRLAQLFYVLGNSCIKHLVSIDNFERAELKKLDDAAAAPANAQAGGAMDVMQKELGMGSTEHARFRIQEKAKQAKEAMFDKDSIWATYAPLVIKTCNKKVASAAQSDPFVRTAAILCMMKLMVASQKFCQNQLRLLFTILSDKNESWVNKSNIVIGLGDLCVFHSNDLQPYMKLDNTGFYAVLADDDRRVRRQAVQIFTYLVLNDMIRSNQNLHNIVRLVADNDANIATDAELFVQHLAIKYKQSIGNLIPPLIPKLTPEMPAEKFQLAMKTMLDKVDKDKPTESLIEKLCAHFTRWSEKEEKFARNISFCLSELNYSSERAVKKLICESSYQKYRPWLRDADVFHYFEVIARRLGRGGPVGEQRRDKAAIEEWEQRIIMDQGVPLDEAEASSGSEENAHPETLEEEERDLLAVSHHSPSPKAASPHSTKSVGGKNSPAARNSASLREEISSQSESESEEEETKAPKRKNGKAPAPKAKATRGKNKSTVKEESEEGSSSSEDQSEEEKPKRKKAPAKKSAPRTKAAAMRSKRK